jgi:hypothetical protein
LYEEAIGRLRSLQGQVAGDMRTIEKSEIDEDFKGLREDPSLGPVFTQVVRDLKAGG